MLGMSICVFDVQIRGKKLQGTVIGLLFLGLSVAVYMADTQNSAMSFVLGLLACAAVILLAAGFEERYGKMMGFLAKYTMPIFLMHTLFAAPTRAALLKVRCYECSSSRCIGSWNWLCRADCSCVDYEENKVVRVLLVPE